MAKKYYKYEETHRKVDGRKQKYCTKCDNWKDESEFNIDRSNRDGLDMRCRDCARVHAQARYRKATKKKKIIVYLRFKDRHRVIKRVRQKLCTKCGKWKKEIEYYRSISEKDGLMCRCKECTYKPGKKSRKRRSALKN
ncbi:MAG: hypothetical protein A2168_08940 [Planctomycetes bacterium RBG_13_50_24]|nr:MAG: hypothetical protein A2168_08940 [Planctomycetes bacterium RBG_13_50_24]